MVSPKVNSISFEVSQDLNILTRHLLKLSGVDRRFIKIETEKTLREVGAVLYVQRIAKNLLQRLNIKTCTIHVGFNKSLPQAGVVELTPSQDVFVEIRHEYSDDADVLAAILAHEVMHVYLNRHKIWLPIEHENERLTDLATLYFGFGILTLNGVSRRKVAVDFANSGTNISRLGYLSLDEFSFVFCKFLQAQSHSFTTIKNKLSHEGMRLFFRGQELLNAECNVHKRNDKIYYKCSGCLTPLSFPSNVNKIRVTCRVCQHVFVFDCKKGQEVQIERS